RHGGIRETIAIATIAPPERSPVESRNDRSAIGTVYISGSVKKISCEKKSFQVQMNVKIAVVARAGRLSGRITLKKIRPCPAPSIRAASSSSRGMPRKKDRKSTRLNSSHVSSSYAVFRLKKKKPYISLDKKNDVSIN